MKLMLRGRQQGKTRRVIEWMMENPTGVVFTPNESYAVVIRDRIRKTPASYPGADPNRIQSIANRDFTRGMDRDTPIAIDNVDGVIQQLVRGHIDLLTATDMEMI